MQKQCLYHILIKYITPAYFNKISIYGINFTYATI